MSTLHAIVPVKPLATAKGRLSAVLSAAQRRQLVLTMLSDVLTALGQVPDVSATHVVTADRDVAAMARTHKAGIVWEDEAKGLNTGVESGLSAVSTAGGTRALVLPADLPFATAQEISQLVWLEGRAPTRPQLAMVPAADGDGTNALLISPPDAVTPSFGPGSFLAHLGQALARRVDVRVLHLAGLALDIDRPDDLARLLPLQRYAFLNGRTAVQVPGTRP